MSAHAISAQAKIIALEKLQRLCVQKISSLMIWDFTEKIPCF